MKVVLAAVVGALAPAAGAVYVFLFYLPPEPLFLMAAVVVSGACAVSLAKEAYSRWGHTEYGASRWAGAFSLRAYIGNHGIVLGRVGFLRRPLSFDGPESVAVVAPPRSGKGRSVVVPTLLQVPWSCLVHDPKSELYSITAKYRRRLGLVHRWAPFEEGSVKWNPLDEVRWHSDHAEADVLAIAEHICSAASKERSHWTASAEQLLTSLILHGKTKGLSTLAACVDQVHDHPQGAAGLWAEMAQSSLATVKSSGEHQQDRAQRGGVEGANVLSTFHTAVSPFLSPMVRSAMESSEFCLKDLMHGRRPRTVYITTPLENQSSVIVSRLFFSLVMAKLVSFDVTFDNGMPKAVYRHRLTMILDECDVFGRWELLKRFLSIGTGSGINCLLIWQTLAQLRDRYGDVDLVLGTLGATVYLKTSDPVTLKYLQSKCGEVTERRKSVSGSGRGRSVTYSYAGRPLATLDRLRRVTAKRSVVDINGEWPAVLRRRNYDKDRVFRDRVRDQRGK